MIVIHFNRMFTNLFMNFMKTMPIIVGLRKAYSDIHPRKYPRILLEYSL